MAAEKRKAEGKGKAKPKTKGKAKAKPGAAIETKAEPEQDGQDEWPDFDAQLEADLEEEWNEWKSFPWFELEHRSVCSYVVWI